MNLVIMSAPMTALRLAILSAQMSAPLQSLQLRSVCAGMEYAVGHTDVPEVVRIVGADNGTAASKVGASVSTGPGDPVGTHDGAEVSALSTLRLAPQLSLKWLSNLRKGGDL